MLTSNRNSSTRKSESGAPTPLSQQPGTPKGDKSLHTQSVPNVQAPVNQSPVTPEPEVPLTSTAAILIARAVAQCEATFKEVAEEHSFDNAAELQGCRDLVGESWLRKHLEEAEERQLKQELTAAWAGFTELELHPLIAGSQHKFERGNGWSHNVADPENAAEEVMVYVEGGKIYFETHAEWSAFLDEQRAAEEGRISVLIEKLWEARCGKKDDEYRANCAALQSEIGFRNSRQRTDVNGAVWELYVSKDSCYWETLTPQTEKDLVADFELIGGGVVRKAISAPPAFLKNFHEELRGVALRLHDNTVNALLRKWLKNDKDRDQNEARIVALLSNEGEPWQFTYNDEDNVVSVVDGQLMILVNEYQPLPGTGGIDVACSTCGATTAELKERGHSIQVLGGWRYGKEPHEIRALHNGVWVQAPPCFHVKPSNPPRQAFSCPESAWAKDGAVSFAQARQMPKTMNSGPSVYQAERTTTVTLGEAMQSPSVRRMMTDDVISKVAANIPAENLSPSAADEIAKLSRRLEKLDPKRCGDVRDAMRDMVEAQEVLAGLE